MISGQRQRWGRRDSIINSEYVSVQRSRASACLVRQRLQPIVPLVSSLLTSKCYPLLKSRCAHDFSGTILIENSRAFLMEETTTNDAMACRSLSIPPPCPHVHDNSAICRSHLCTRSRRRPPVRILSRSRRPPPVTSSTRCRWPDCEPQRRFLTGFRAPPHAV